MAKRLPVFFEYTVDLRLRQFRYVCRQCGAFEVIPFESEEGDALSVQLLAFYNVGGTLFAIEFEGEKQKAVPISRSDIEDAILRANGDFGPYGM